MSKYFSSFLRSLLLVVGAVVVTLWLVPAKEPAEPSLPAESEVIKSPTEGWVKIVTPSGDTIFFDDTPVRCAHPEREPIDLDPRPGGTKYALPSGGDNVCAARLDDAPTTTARVKLLIMRDDGPELAVYQFGKPVTCTMSDGTEKNFNPLETSSTPEVVADPGAECSSL